MNKSGKNGPDINKKGKMQKKNLKNKPKTILPFLSIKKV